MRVFLIEFEIVFRLLEHNSQPGPFDKTTWMKFFHANLQRSSSLCPRLDNY